jgi:hypothetical protein
MMTLKTMQMVVATVDEQWESLVAAKMQSYRDEFAWSSDAN